MAEAVMIYRVNPAELEVPEKEIYRYMGFDYEAGLKETKEQGMTYQMMQECLLDVKQGSQMQVCYSRFPVQTSMDGRVNFGFASLLSRNLAENLKNCQEVIIFAATIGMYIDKQISMQLLRSPAKATIYQAVGAATVEALCDRFNEKIQREQAVFGKKLHPRYSPGYGDLRLEFQKEIFRVLDCPRNAGISLSSSFHMIPEKSVTAIIGIEGK